MEKRGVTHVLAHECHRSYLWNEGERQRDGVSTGWFSHVLVLRERLARSHPVRALNTHVKSRNDLCLYWKTCDCSYTDQWRCYHTRSRSGPRSRDYPWTEKQLYSGTRAHGSRLKDLTLIDLYLHSRMQSNAHTEVGVPLSYFFFYSLV